MCFADNQQWSILNTSGALVKGGYGHSSVFDKLTRQILVHGGYVSESATIYALTDALYAFSPDKSSW